MYEYAATVVRWVDGDTVDLRVDLGFHLTQEARFRLLGVDTPERGQEGHVEARVYCERIAPVGAEVEAVTTKADKYGRFLVTIWSGGVEVNASLLAQGLAVPYAGGTKP